ncbi:hypothetical protein H0H93_006234 [Arthromyces matolae]|nr:hypothetical protein H0H93_006234 [Arthromyces matolae]
MFTSKSSALALLLLSVASTLEAVTITIKRDEGTIGGLLRSFGPGTGSIARRASCQIGDFACSDGSGCCPDTDYCGEWDGILGCCPIGFTCGGAATASCSKSNYVECASFDFCCPAGGFCDESSSGSPLCYNSDGSSAAVDNGGSSSGSGTTVVGGGSSPTTAVTTKSSTTVVNVGTTSTHIAVGTTSTGAAVVTAITTPIVTPTTTNNIVTATGGGGPSGLDGGSSGGGNGAMAMSVNIAALLACVIAPLLVL